MNNKQQQMNTAIKMKETKRETLKTPIHDK